MFPVLRDGVQLSTGEWVGFSAVGPRLLGLTEAHRAGLCLRAVGAVAALLSPVCTGLNLAYACWLLGEREWGLAALAWVSLAATEAALLYFLHAPEQSFTHLYARTQKIRYVSCLLPVYDALVACDALARLVASPDAGEAGHAWVEVVMLRFASALSLLRAYLNVPLYILQLAHAASFRPWLLGCHSVFFVATCALYAAASRSLCGADAAAQADEEEDAGRELETVTPAAAAAADAAASDAAAVEKTDVAPVVAGAGGLAAGGAVGGPHAESSSEAAPTFLNVFGLPRGSTKMTSQTFTLTFIYVVVYSTLVGIVATL